MDDSLRITGQTTILPLKMKKLKVQNEIQFSAYSDVEHLLKNPTFLDINFTPYKKQKNVFSLTDKSYSTY